MSTVTWQDGFEGGENLTTVYTAIGATVVGGSAIVSGGRGGGHAFQGSIFNIPTGIAAITDPVIMGFARKGSLGGAANLALGDGTSFFASLGVDVLGRIAVTLSGVAGSPVITATDSDPRLDAVWRYIEWYYTADTVAGRVIVELDGDRVIDFTGATAPAARGPSLGAIGGNGSLDDFYIGLPASTSDFFGDYVITGLAPGAAGSVPAPGDVVTSQQFIVWANTAPKQNATVDQQYIIVVIKNRGPSKVRPQVFGVGRS